MSYDLIFWRGAAPDPPNEVLQKLARGEAVPGIEPLEREEVLAAFNRAFQGQVKVESRPAADEYLHGRLYSLHLREPLHFLWVTCSWKVLEQPQILQKLTIAGYCHLRCNMYNPQIDEFLEAERRDR